MQMDRQDFVSLMLAAGVSASNLDAAPAPTSSAVADRYTAPVASVVDGMLGARLEVNIEKRLLEGVNLDILLAGYRNRPGVQTWIGEHVGKFIDAALYGWEASGDDRLRRKAETAAHELIANQLEDGYLGTYLKADRWIDWDLWAHKYNLIGLLHHHRLFGGTDILTACRRMADLVIRIYGPNGLDIIQKDKHVGMANTSILEPMTQLYRATSDKKYLDFCLYIVKAWDGPKGPKIIQSLLQTGSVYKVANAKAYEMLSNLVGLLELYRLTGSSEFFEPVEIAWEDIRRNHLYLSGSASWRERFHPDGLLRADDAVQGGVGEGCVTTTWMQMNMHLLRLTGEAKYAEELERTIYNALLGSQHPAKGTICYFTPLNGAKPYGAVSHGVNGVNCCNSSIPRGLALVPFLICGRKDRGIAMNLYSAGRFSVDLEGQRVEIVSKTSFPKTGEVELTLLPGKPAKFTLHLRVPAWTKRFDVVTASGMLHGTPGSYLSIDKEWKHGETIKVSMDMTLQVLSGSPTYPEHLALRRGPQVLALESVTYEDSDLFLAGLNSTQPELMEDETKAPNAWIGSQVFRVEGYAGTLALGRKPKRLRLVPLSDAGQLGHEYRVWLQRPPG